MGLIMKGIDTRPTAVVVHLRTGEGRLVENLRAFAEAQHILLIVNPGTITEAKPCHTNESTTA